MTDKTIDRDPQLWNVINEMQASLNNGTPVSPEVLNSWVSRLETTNTSLFEDVYEQLQELVDPHTDAQGGELPCSVIESASMLIEHWAATKGEVSPFSSRELFEAWAVTDDGNCASYDLRRTGLRHQEYDNPEVERDYVVFCAALQTRLSNAGSFRMEALNELYDFQEISGCSTAAEFADKTRGHDDQ